MAFPLRVSPPLLKDVKIHAPQAVWEVAPLNAARDAIINRTAAPFDKPEARRAVAFAIDRKAFTDILLEGRSSIGGAMMPPPEGGWGLPPETLTALPGHQPAIEKERTAPRQPTQDHRYERDS